MTPQTHVRRELLVLGGYLVLTLLLTYPLVLNFATAIPGDGADSWQYYWNLWWVKRALLELHSNPYWTADLYYPEGAWLYFQTLLLAPDVLALPLIQAFGLTVGYNWIVLLGFVLGGYGTYLLTLYLVCHDASRLTQYHVHASFLAGAVFTFSAFHFTQLFGHLEQVSLQWLPFYVLYLIKVWRESGWRNVALAVFFLVITCLTSWYYALYLLVFTPLWVLWAILPERKQSHSQNITRVVLVLALAGLVLLPVLVPMLVLGRTMGRVSDPVGNTLRYSADLLAFVTPSLSRTLGGSELAPLYQVLVRDGNATEATVFLGFVPLALAGIAVYVWRKRVSFWLISLLVFALFALGPSLHIGGQMVTIFNHTVPLPYKLFLLVPYGDIARTPSRFVVICELAIAVLVGYGALALFERVRSTRVVVTGFVALLLLVLAETGVLPYPLAPPNIPPFYTWLRQQPQPTALLEIPIPDDPAVYPRRMLYQTEHAKPVYGGYVSRGLPPAYLNGLPGFVQFKSLSLQARDITSEEGVDARQDALANWKRLDTGYVVMDKTLLTPSQQASARQVAGELLNGAAPRYEDDTTLMYAVPPVVLTGPIILVSQDWYSMETALDGASSDVPPRWRWMPAQSSLDIVGAGGGRWQLQVRAWSFREPRHLTMWLDDAPIATFSIFPNRQTLSTPPFTLTAGEHHLRFESREPPAIPGGGDPRALTIAFSEIHLVSVAP